ncbi:MAG: hypothetical protein AAFR61_08640 [Bacteroidota bacterium]
MKFIYHIYIVGLLSLMLACQPFVPEKTELGPPPTPTFEILTTSNSNDFILQNTTEGGFLAQWDLGQLGKFEGQEVEINIPFKGTYEITLLVFNSGGHATATKSLTVDQDDPNACSGNFRLLTGCGEKVWKIAPEPGALHVGPNLTDTWWGNNEGDVTARECHFNDEYIFRSNGEFEYDNKGDFWADSDGSGAIFPPALGLSVGCHPSSDWPDAFKSWDSGLHGFSVTNSTITVSGEGAWIGLYKIGTSGEVGTPQTSVTLNIDSLTEDRMVLYADYGGVVWRITLVAE